MRRRPPRRAAPTPGAPRPTSSAGAFQPLSELREHWTVAPDVCWTSRRCEASLGLVAASRASLHTVLDRDIRQALRTRAARLHADDPETRIVEELDLGPGARADLVVLNGRIEGYEIKSDHDSLIRLAHQVAAYEAVCDRVWLVTTERFASSVLERLPAWWGVLIATHRGDEIVLVRHRAARAHGQQRVRALPELLWKSELLSVCDRHAVSHMRSKSTVVALRDSIAETRISGRRAANEVRGMLLLREGWRAVRPCGSGDAPSPPVSRSSASRSVLPPHRRR